jgi:uncharacterized circularly permuted ATP-grasp superfamily protein
VGVDLVRTGPEEFYVLEDNARTPSGVSYMLENRETMLQMFPELFSANKVVAVSGYPQNLRRSLAASSPGKHEGNPVIAVLTPGIHNSAYFEHSFLADQMGTELVEGHDLKLVDGRIAMRTAQGYKPIDVLYRRVDDEFLDPLNFNPDSVLGVPGIMDVYRAGNITLTRRSTPTCLTSWNSTPAKRPCCRMCPLGVARNQSHYPTFKIIWPSLS